VGGSESYVRGLIGEYRTGNGPERVTVLANRHVAADYQELGSGPVALQHVRSYRPGDGLATRAAAIAVARAFPRAVARDVPDDLDVVHYPVTLPIPRTDRPTVVTIHDLVHHELPGAIGRAETWHRRWAYDAAARAGTMVIAVSRHTRDAIVERLGVAPDRVEVVPHGIDHERFSPEGESSGPELPERFVLYPANLWPHKNHGRLLEALARVGDPDLVLVLTGGETRRLPRLMARAAELGVASRVRHVGYVPPGALAALYRRARALVFPSLFEGFGAPPLEAMACGCPVASSTRAALGEVCDDAALPFDPEDPESIAAAIDRVTSDESLRSSLRTRGLERASAFTWKASAERHRAIYERAAQR
jgi:glycosyltransferase involved in cell wall biosynthesis